MLLIGNFGCDVLDDYLGIERNVSNIQNTSDDDSDEETMDYYLLRDGRKLFEQMQYSDGYYVDVTTVWKYYGVLKVYN